MFLEFLKGKLWEITVHRITVQIFRFTFRASDPSSVVVGSNATQDNFLQLLQISNNSYIYELPRGHWQIRNNRQSTMSVFLTTYF